MLISYEDIDASVPIEVAEDRVARVAGSGETQACRSLRESSVEIVAVHCPLTISDEKQVQVAVVIEVYEERPPGCFHVADPGLRSRLLKRPVAPVAEQVPASFGADDEEIEPAIVVVISECGVRRTLRKRDARTLSGVS